MSLLLVIRCAPISWLNDCDRFRQLFARGLERCSLKGRFHEHAVRRDAVAPEINDRIIRAPNWAQNVQPSMLLISGTGNSWQLFLGQAREELAAIGKIFYGLHYCSAIIFV
jgi:hypothetical protein